MVLEGYAGAFGGHAGTVLGTLGLSWRLVKAIFGHLEAISKHLEATLRLCWVYVRQLGALPALFQGKVGPFGAHFGTMLGFLRAVLRLLVPMLDRLEATFGLLRAPLGSHGGF